MEQAEVMDVDAEREKITKEIKELERILDPSTSNIHMEVSESSLDSDSDAVYLFPTDSLPSEDLEAVDPPILEEERWGEASNDEEDPKDKTLPEDPETCLQLNMVYQEVIQEKLAEVSLLLAQNREQQGPPANEETREKAAQGIKAFEELLVTKWKHWEKALLRKSVVSDRLQRLLQPKLLKLEYLRQKQSRVSSESEQQALEKQVREAEKEIQDINQLPEEALLGNRMDNHDWEKISNIHFEGGRSAEEIRKFWQSSEHPSINKQEWSVEEVEQLRAIAATHGHLEWHLVAEELGTSRSAFQCLQKFQQHNKALKRKEWTEEEDRMLTQLVQEMRVGSHIPYRRIVYYMEGRDSMQLIYRWTKSLDPSLKKGFWAPEEDAKLLQAVAKYGEQDWFKIREEVPGRSDAQCRDRYLRRLHFSLKKGRWNEKEEEQLIELIEKYGVGHWAKIASELPHRSGSQCLSKWKVMAGKKKSLRRRRRRPCRRVRWSSDSSSSCSTGGGSSSSSSSSSSEDPETELEEPQKGLRGPLSPKYTVPDMNLWVPARQNTSQLQRGEAGGCSGHPAAFTGPSKESDATQGCSREASSTALAPQELNQREAPTGIHSPIPRGVQDPHLADHHPASLEEPASEGGQHLLKVPLVTVQKVLRTSMAVQNRTLLRHGTFQNGQQHRRHNLHRRLLERRLLLAVTPWVGDIALPCAQVPPRPAAVHTRANTIRMQLEPAQLASTPVFTLLIQLLQIDTAGCLDVVRERKTQPPTSLQSGTQGLPPHLLQAPSCAQSTPGCPFPNVPTRNATKSASHRGSTGQESCQANSTSPQAPVAAPRGSRPKPKTVSELLREKRLREARARRATQGPALPPQLLVSPVTLGPPVLPAPQPQGSPATGSVSSTDCFGPGALMAASACPSGCWQETGVSAKDEGLPTLQALPLSPAPSPGQVPVGCPLSILGQSQAPTTSRKQGLPEVLPFFPAAPSPTQLPMQPLNLTPALGTHRSGTPLAASIPLPVTWVLTAQGLLPMPVPAVVGLPGPAGLPAKFPPPCCEAPACPSQPQASVDTEPAPSSRTDTSAPPTCPPSQSPLEVGGNVPGALGEAQVVKEATVPRTSSQTNCPEAEPSRPSQLSASVGTGPTNGSGGTLEPGGPLGLEKPQLSGSEKGVLDLSLLSLESEAATRQWLRGQQGVHVPPLGNRLPYQPPTLSSLRALSNLLLHKKALEHKASSLVASGAAGTLQASLELVRRQLQDNPAYLLLKARFLAAFTLPALLATLAPHGIRTTLSVATRASSESEDEDLLSELDLEDRDNRLGCAPSRTQTRPATTVPIQGALVSNEGAVPSHSDTSDDLDVLRTRHGRHARKQKPLL
ncbi:small nuclear RNA activating complex polypeptide 4, transcript variant X6 [Ictidomys tridecemlineatus]|uniref:snRNA-activating protein complex subunit 4 isoform X5 n=1 Tax=Ictidomys tridecemlineatus TaxID=43179 RepID=UPI000B543E9A|nr:snRNA-activating protein complex subunit 4 isoform X5 [Ictidomys tridecemlineatus]KAG3288354.1 small nuclear RNA activating complex polypeptide 4, transcript variant X6 [Ictidomys tridecemlineatus]